MAYLITGDEIASAGIRVEPVVGCESIFTSRIPLSEIK
ncbi:hypothetical protein GXM_05116 [Nostoc sphaeroides CCNUC1]|uniref:Uncharacterized protein n=1 Tax=Nostoc sphaeroides CCNUC1 TaxID=2653204 RepID=A0A5P8W4Q4_9NOSO|nr:hypothetical protein GXM_05116 [Nostoc sphaeroides CCNUC1]